VVGRRFVRAEAFPRGWVDRMEMRILVKVGSEYRENRYHRKGKGSLAMQISQGVVDPNQAPNGAKGKGNRLIFLYYLCMRGNAMPTTDASEYPHTHRRVCQQAYVFGEL
jgi:hypothetical protein